MLGEIKALEAGMVLIYMLAMLFLGIYLSKRALKSQVEYWIASRFLGVLPGGLAMYAVVGSASTMIGMAGLTYNMGLPFGAAVAIAFAAQFPLVAYLTSKPLLESDICTLGDFFKQRFEGKRINVLYSVIVIVFISLFVIPQLRASGIVGEWLIGVNFDIVLVVVGLTFLIYSSIGGMWAVTVTDIIQGIVMFAGALCLSLIALVKFGGFGNLLTSSLAARPILANLGMPTISVIGLASTWVFIGIVFPTSIMRTLTMRNPRSARRSMLYSSMLGGLTVGFVALVIAMAAANLAPEGLSNPDMAFVIVMNEFCPPLLRGFLVVGILAAIMSSTDSALLAVSATIARDVYQGVINPKASERTVIRLAVISMWVVGLLIIFLSLRTTQLISILAAMAAGGLIASFLAPTLMTIYWKRATRNGVFTGMLIGFVAFAFLNLSHILPSMTEVLIATPLSAIVTYGVSLIENKNTMETEGAR